MTILAVYYTLADIVLLGQYFWYEGFRLTDPVSSREGSGEDDDDEDEEEPTERAPLLSPSLRDRHDLPGNGFHIPRISDADGRRRSSAHSSNSFRERFLSVSSTHLSPVIPLHDDPDSAPSKPPRSQAPSAVQAVFFNVGIIILVCASGVFGWWLSTTRSNATTPPPTESSPETLQFNLWGQVFGYICAALYLSSRVPQLLLNYRRKSTDGISMLFFLFACIGNLTYVLSIVAYKPVCRRPKHCREGEALSIYGRYIAVNLSWLLGSFGTLLLDAGVFIQYFLYRKEDDSDSEEEVVR